MLVKLETRDAKGVVLSATGYMHSGPPRAIDCHDGNIEIQYACRGQCDFMLHGDEEELQLLASTIERAISRKRQRERAKVTA